MNVKKWYAARGPNFVVQRASKLLDRYGLTPAKSTDRIENGVRILAKHACAPTFFTPGIVVERHSRFIQRLQSEGAEIAIHSYQHVDFHSLTLTESVDQLKKAQWVFQRFGIEARGFRCPYLSYTDDLLQSLQAGFLDYSSNRAIWLEVPSLNQAQVKTVIYHTLRQFYHPALSLETVCMPWSQPNLIEIPICVPDDLQLHDGLGLDPDGISRVWIEMLDETHRRGELFNLIFHPELSEICEYSFDETLRHAAALKPGVWMARLRDISDWWKEKSAFRTEVSRDTTNLYIHFSCTPRATILAKGLASLGSGSAWDETYSILQDRTLVLRAGVRPFIGLEQSAPQPAVSFLQEQGYILDTGETAPACGIYLDNAALARLDNNVKLVDAIETAHAPLVRFGRWPAGARSALCVSGDLDAITLLDYATRLYKR